MEKTIAFFDFDGTITNKDSMVEFIKYCKGNAAFYKSLAVLSPWLAGMKLGLLKKSFAKEKMLSYFFKGTNIEEFNGLCKKFSDNRLPGLVRADALEAIKDHQKAGHEVVVVSASAENWLIHWCNNKQVKCIGTKLFVDQNNILTGKLSGANCNGIEKVTRIKQAYNLSFYKTIYCYGDSKGDVLMLKIGTHPFYRHFIK